jgi:hypothetical protein
MLSPFTARNPLIGNPFEEASFISSSCRLCSVKRGSFQFPSGNDIQLPAIVRCIKHNPRLCDARGAVIRLGFSVLKMCVRARHCTHAHVWGRVWAVQPATDRHP